MGQLETGVGAAPSQRLRKLLLFSFWPWVFFTRQCNQEMHRRCKRPRFLHDFGDIGDK